MQILEFVIYNFYRGFSKWHQESISWLLTTFPKINSARVNKSFHCLFPCDNRKKCSNPIYMLVYIACKPTIKSITWITKAFLWRMKTINRSCKRQYIWLIPLQYKLLIFFFIFVVLTLWGHVPSFYVFVTCVIWLSN